MPGDLNSRTAGIVARATSEHTPPEPENASITSGRRGGLKGGKVRAERMTPEQRSESARHAVKVRWSRHKEA